MTATRDKYDEAIEWLVESPQFLGETWSEGALVSDGPECLFAFCSPDGNRQAQCGCLTMIRLDYGSMVVGSNLCAARDLTDAIRADRRLPTAITKIDHLRGEELRAALQPFAEWQRRLDKEIRGVSP